MVKKYRCESSAHARNTRGNNINFKLNILEPWEEIDGKLLSIVSLEGSVIVTFSKEYSVELEDNGLAKNLRRLINKHVGILRTDEGYRLMVKQP